MAYALVLETETALVVGTSAVTDEILERVAEDGLEELLLVDPGSRKVNATDAEYTVWGAFEDHSLSLRCGSTDSKTLDYQRTNPQFSSVPQSCPTLRPHESQHARPPCPSPFPRVRSDSRPSSR